MKRYQRTDPFSFKSFVPTSEFNGEEGGGSPAPEKTPEQIQNEITAAMNDEPIVETGTEPPANSTLPKTETTPPPASSTPPSTQEFTPNNIWNFIKKDYESQIGENTFVMPEGITAENEHQKLIEFLQQNIEPSVEGMHPFVQEVYNAGKNKDFDPNKFLEEKLQQKTYLDLPNDEFLKLHLKNIAEKDKTGWTDEDIDTHIKNRMQDKIGFDAEVNGLKKQYRDYEESLVNKQREESKKKLDADYEQQITKRNNDIATLIEQNKNEKEFFGMTFGEADLKEFHTWLPEMLKVNKETGSYPLLDYLRSDKNLMKVAAIVYKGEKGMRDYLSDLKEGVKSDLMAKLRLTPNVDGGSISVGSSNPDIEKAYDD